MPTSSSSSASGDGSDASTGTGSLGPTTGEDSVGATGSTGPGPADSTGDDASGDDTSSSTGPDCQPGTESCPCDAGGCAGSLVCVGDVCQAAECDGDVFEPNDDEASAEYLGEINDNDNNGGVVSASLHSPIDVDWFSYHGDDDITGNVNPEREVVSSAGLRLCKFLECDNGLAQTTVECPAGTDYALSPMARPGCCANGDVPLPDLDCDGTTNDSAMVFIRIDEPAEDCVTYSVAYHY